VESLGHLNLRHLRHLRIKLRFPRRQWGQGNGVRSVSSTFPSARPPARGVLAGAASTAECPVPWPRSSSPGDLPHPLDQSPTQVARRHRHHAVAPQSPYRRVMSDPLHPSNPSLADTRSLHAGRDVRAARISQGSSATVSPSSVSPRNDQIVNLTDLTPLPQSEQPSEPKQTTDVLEPREHALKAEPSAVFRSRFVSQAGWSGS